LFFQFSEKFSFDKSNGVLRNNQSIFIVYNKTKYIICIFLTFKWCISLNILYFQKINRLTKLYSDQKLEMSALDVFKHSIAFVKGELLREMDKQKVRKIQMIYFVLL
jgi:hypothetical protein